MLQMNEIRHDFELVESDERVDGDERPAAVDPLVGRRRIVMLGGGTGLSNLLRGLRPLYFPSADVKPSRAERDLLTAIVTVADDGGSSGLLRQAYPMLAPGDIRTCLQALAGQPMLQSLFDFRFNSAVGSHSLGNLILTALSELESDFTRGVERACELLDVRGRVLPATSDNVALQATFADGTTVYGESSIASTRKQIESVELVPCAYGPELAAFGVEPSATIRALPQACDALRRADTIVLGPGSLYTSILPNLLVPGIAEAIIESHARVIFVMNLMTEPGETDGYSASDFLQALHWHAPRIPVHFLLQNATPIPHPQRERYGANGAQPIEAESRTRIDPHCQCIARDLLGDMTHTSGTPLADKIRHDPHKLARAILEISA